MIQHNRFNLFLQCIGELIAVAAEYFNAVKFAGIMGCGQHHACIGFIFSHQKGNCRGRHHAKLYYIGPHATEPRRNGGLQHVGGKARILANQHLGVAMVAIRQHHCGGPPNAHGHFTGQFAVGNASYAIGSKKSAHM